jgi:hypothetical protein
MAVVCTLWVCTVWCTVIMGDGTSVSGHSSLHLGMVDEAANYGCAVSCL